MLGTLLMLASLALMGVLLWSQRNVVINFRPSFGDLIVFGLSAVIFCVAGACKAIAWRILLQWSGENEVPWLVSLRIYARSEIAKYLPGNVMQLLGRHAMGRKIGWSHAGLVLSNAFEMLMILIVSSVIAVVGLVLTGIEVEMVQLPVLLGLIACLLAGAIVVLRLVPRLVVGIWPEVANRLRSRDLSGLWPVGLLHVAYFMIGGLVTILVSDVVLEQPISAEYWPALIALFAIAWTAGVITPGAPSGIGIREAVLVAGLSPVASPASAVLIAGLLRLISVVGDILFFLIGISEYSYWHPREAKKAEDGQSRA